MAELRLALPYGREHRVGVGRLLKPLHQVGAVREHREPREDVQVGGVVGGADEEEVPRAVAVGRAEEDGTLGAAVGNE